MFVLFGVASSDQETLYVKKKFSLYLQPPKKKSSDKKKVNSGWKVVLFASDYIPDAKTKNPFVFSRSNPLPQAAATHHRSQL